MDTKDEKAGYWVKRFEALESDRRGFWDNHLQSLSDYIIPRKAKITVKRSKGADLDEYHFDSTSIHANELLASRMQASLVPSSSKWFTLRGVFPREYQKNYKEDLNENNNVKEWFDDCAEEMFAAINASNFNTAIHELFLDLGCFGTACMSMEGTPDERGRLSGFKFQAIPIQDYVFSENIDGEVDFVIRKLKKSARQALQRWDKKNLHPSIMEAIKEDPDQEYDFLHIVYPKEDFDPHTKKTKNNLPYGSLIIDQKNKELVEEAGYEEFPFFVCRWAKAAGEKYGRGPGRTAISDIKVLNACKRLEMRAWPKIIDPPIMVENDAYIGSIKLAPSSIIPVRDINRPPIPFVIGSQWDISNLKKDELIQSIKRIFYSDQLQFPEQQSNKMTAREVMVRYELMQSLLGSTFGRIVSELLNPLISRMFSKMDRNRMFADRPASLADVDKLKVAYTSPLALAQKVEEAQAIDVWLESILPLAQIEPGILSMIDLKEVARVKADLLGVPARLMRSKEEELEIEEGMKAQQEQEAQMENTMKETQALKNMAPFMQQAEGMMEPEMEGQL
tara:strand:+ start:3238 stop:4926 length:1689 start_codon:yes stop_codon:yes gene_type:complete